MIITDQDLDLIWNALHFYREEGIPESANNKEWETEWSDVCTVMAWIEEDLTKESSFTNIKEHIA